MGYMLTLTNRKIWIVGRARFDSSLLYNIYNQIISLLYYIHYISYKTNIDPLGDPKVPNLGAGRVDIFCCPHLGILHFF